MEKTFTKSGCDMVFKISSLFAVFNTIEPENKENTQTTKEQLFTFDKKEEPKVQPKEEKKPEPEQEVKKEVKQDSKVKESKSHPDKETKATPKEEPKVQPKEEKKPEPEQEVKKEENLSEKDKVTMKMRVKCPVKKTDGVKIKVKTVEDKKAETNTKKHQKDENNEEHRLMHLVQHLRENNVTFTPPMKQYTGLYETGIMSIRSNIIPISVDINGLLYSDEIKFFIGKMKPGDEYNKPAIMMTNETISCVVKEQRIDSKYYITESLFNLNKVIDLQTLKKKNPEERAKIFANTAKVISDEDIYNSIIKAANGEPYRFAYSRVISENEFSIVSSKKNLSSNLTNDKLLVSKEIWINYKDGNVELTTKSYS